MVVWVQKLSLLSIFIQDRLCWILHVEKKSRNRSFSNTTIRNCSGCTHRFCVTDGHNTENSLLFSIQRCQWRRVRYMQGKKPRESNDERRVSAVSKNKQLMHKTLTMTSKYNYLFPHSPTPLFFYFILIIIQIRACVYCVVVFHWCCFWHSWIEAVVTVGIKTMYWDHNIRHLFCSQLKWISLFFRTLHLRVWRDWRIVSVWIRLDQ